MNIVGFLFFFCLISLVKSNFWDNIFSQLRSPQIVLPEESKVEIFNGENKIMEVLISSSLNIAKFSLIDKHFIKKVVNFTGTSDFLNIYANFTNGTVRFDWEDKCSFLNTSILTKFKLKFFLASYDLLTFFNEGPDFYEYVLTNPLHTRNQNEKLKFLADNIQGKYNYLLSLDISSSTTVFPQNQISMKEKINYFNKVFSLTELLENESKIVFKVNKNNKNLEKISLTYKQIANMDLTTKTYDKTAFDEKDFRLRNNCTLFKLENDSLK
jgi:hypothetical protein